MAKPTHEALQILQKKLSDSINSRPHMIAIVRNVTVETPPREVFQWRDNAGTPYSPAMTSLTECQDYPKNNGLNPIFE